MFKMNVRRKCVHCSVSGIVAFRKRERQTLYAIYSSCETKNNLIEIHREELLSVDDQ